MRLFKDRGPCYIGFGEYSHAFRTLETRDEYKVLKETDYGEYGGRVTIFKCARCGLVKERVLCPQWRLKEEKVR